MIVGKNRNEERCWREDRVYDTKLCTALLSTALLSSSQDRKRKSSIEWDCSRVIKMRVNGKVVIT
jgi:hypothetical protein